VDHGQHQSWIGPTASYAAVRRRRRGSRGGDGLAQYDLFLFRSNPGDSYQWEYLRDQLFGFDKIFGASQSLKVCFCLCVCVFVCLCVCLCVLLCLCVCLFVFDPIPHQDARLLEEVVAQAVTDKKLQEPIALARPVR
jgi:hypothetical protein